MTPYPKVSVIMPAYNEAALTVRAVQSVFNQTYSNIECFVIDDGSTDDTFNKIYSLLENNPLVYVGQHNKGASAARNVGIKQSTGEYLAFLDCDDLYRPDKIHTSLTQMKFQKVEMIYSSAILIDNKGKPLGIYKPRRHNLLFRNSIMNSVVIKREVFDKVGLFDEDLFICADWDMWLRVEEYFKIGYINYPLSFYRI